jgi:hypothetical protein
VIQYHNHQPLILPVVDTNRYRNNSLRQSLPSARSGDAEYSESTSQRSCPAGYPVLFSIFASDCKSPCPMDSTRVPQELRVLKNMHNRVTVCVLCLFVVMASFVAIKWLVPPLPLRWHPRLFAASLPSLGICWFIICQFDLKKVP